jgi:hypothetical protein
MPLVIAQATHFDIVLSRSKQHGSSKWFLKARHVPVGLQIIQPL